ncbi:MAG: HAD-IA family hydrolase [Leptospirales bacterium]|nr:HAD-IA family hydrolase [Leptospirales bacterium]
MFFHCLVRYYLFDLMDTVVEDPYHGTIQALLQEIPFHEWRSYREPGAFESWECGQISEEEYFDVFYRKTLHPETRSRLIHPARIKEHLYSRPIAFKTGMAEALTNLKKSGRLALVSNYSPWFTEVLRLRPELSDLFHHRFFSSELGVRKPFPDYYARVARALNITGEDQVFFIDDRAENLIEPSRAGWHPHLFKNASELLKWLAAFPDAPAHNRQI